MSMFLQTMTKAISDYRQILRRYLPSKERTEKVKQLRLKDPSIFKNEYLLYMSGQAIIEDIENNMQIPDEGYYSYYGISKYCQYLKEYLVNYEIQDGKIVHKAQKTANAMIKVIQIFALPDENLNDNIAAELKECVTIIALCGSEEQCRIFAKSLSRQAEYAPGFYGEILKFYHSLKTK